MKRSGLLLFCGANILTLAGILPAKAAVPSDNPYTFIAGHNVFGLQQQTTPQHAVEPAKPPPKISLTGFTTILGSPEVLFRVSNSIGATSPVDKFYTLGEGETKDDVRVVQIDARHGFVTFNNHGVIQKIPFGEVATHWH